MEFGNVVRNVRIQPRKWRNIDPLNHAIGPHWVDILPFPSLEPGAPAKWRGAKAAELQVGLGGSTNRTEIRPTIRGNRICRQKRSDSYPRSPIGHWGRLGEWVEFRASRATFPIPTPTPQISGRIPVTIAAPLQFPLYRSGLLRRFIL